MAKAKIDLELIEDGAEIRELIDMIPLLKRALHVTGLRAGPGRPKGSTKKKAAAKKPGRPKGRRGPGRPKKNA